MQSLLHKASPTYLESVTLVNEVLLSLGRVVHLGGVRTDQSVEESVETAVHVRLQGRTTTNVHEDPDI